MLNQKVILAITVLIVVAHSLALLGCEASSPPNAFAGKPLLGTVAASVHLAQLTDPTIDITLTGSGDEISLVADVVDPVTGMVTYSGTYNTTELDVELGSEVTDFSISFNNSGNTHYALAVSTVTNEAYSMQFVYDAGEVSAIVRTINGVELATASATGAWEVSYPPTEDINLVGLLAIVVLDASSGCDPKFMQALAQSKQACDHGLASFSYSCNQETGDVDINFVCAPAPPSGD